MDVKAERTQLNIKHTRAELKHNERTLTKRVLIKARAETDESLNSGTFLHHHRNKKLCSQRLTCVRLKIEGDDEMCEISLHSCEISVHDVVNAE